MRRLQGAVRHVERLIRGDIANPERHRIEVQGHQVTVVDLHNLNDRAKRFVVGVAVRRAFEDKERAGQSDELLFLVLDELNKYAPSEGASPIKEVLLDVAERGRSLGVILIGAQQTAARWSGGSSPTPRSGWWAGSTRPRRPGRSTASSRPHRRQRATILKPGTMLVAQPEMPVPLVLEFPFPAWATRASEAGREPGEIDGPADPFEDL